MTDMESNQKTAYYCACCGSTDVHLHSWTDPNNNNKFVKKVDDTHDGWCNACKDVVILKEECVEQQVCLEDLEHCENCGSTKVQRKAWVRPNNDNEYVDNVNEGDNHADDCWCDYCEGRHVIISHKELMENIDDWFENDLDPDDPEVISGLNCADYDTEEEFDAACQTLWDARTNEEKISIWKVLTFDKSR